MCEPPKPRLITGSGAISAFRVSFHLTMLEDPTNRTSQFAGGAKRSAAVKRAISSANSSCSAGVGAVCAPKRQENARTSAHNVKRRLNLSGTREGITRAAGSIMGRVMVSKDKRQIFLCARRVYGLLLYLSEEERVEINFSVVPGTGIEPVRSFRNSGF